LFEIDKGVLSPDGKANLFPRYQRAAVTQKESRDFCGLLLKTQKRAASAKLQGPFIKLEIAKMDHRQVERRESGGWQGF
jgi:hypothetical protein